MLDISLKYLDWDSEQLGFPCGLIDCTSMETVPVPEVLDDFINKLIKENKDIDNDSPLSLDDNDLNNINNKFRRPK